MTASTCSVVHPKGKDHVSLEVDSGGCRFEGAQGVRATGRRARSEIGKQALSGPFAGMEASLLEVSYPPGGRSAEHRHPGFIVGYVLEGQIRFAINHETPRVLRRGEMFYEPTGALHSTSENAQPGMPATNLAFMVAPPGRPVAEGK
jgi:quercetin dioxygenase-like cupin family protein